ncbi:MAG: hypothetical protein ACTSSO_07420 [Candidatus Hodarchaeales archaeon]
MSTIEQSLEESIEVMNLSFMAMQTSDEFSAEFEALFEKAAKKVERLLRIKALAEGRKECL